MRSDTKCRSKNPSECRVHSDKSIFKQDFMTSVRVQMREQREREQLEEFQNKAQSDFANSWKLRTHADGTTTASVYRSGRPSAPAERVVERDSYERCDSLIPDSRQGRMTGVFCSPTIGGVSRWVRGNWLCKIADVEVREIRVDIDNTYVYLVHDWERASSLNTDDMYKRYWENGMTLREYMEVAQKEPHKYDPREYELLVSSESIASVKKVSGKRLLQFAYDSHEELSDIYKQIAREKRFAAA